jgi:hypothetical protein
LIRDDRIRHLLCLVIGLTISDHAASVKYGRPVPYTLTGEDRRDGRGLAGEGNPETGVKDITVTGNHKFDVLTPGEVRPELRALGRVKPTLKMK